MTPPRAPDGGRRVRQRRKALVVAIAGVVVALGVAVGALLVDSSGTPAPDRHNREASVQACVGLWNRPANASERAQLNGAALAGPSASSTTPGRPPVEARAFVLRYAGPPLEDVGVGEPGVNATRGDCIVAHPSNVLFLYTRGAWHQVGYSPGLAFTGIPQKATNSPNAVVAVRRPGTGRIADQGTIELAR